MPYGDGTQGEVVRSDDHSVVMRLADGSHRTAPLDKVEGATPTLFDTRPARAEQAESQGDFLTRMMHAPLGDTAKAKDSIENSDLFTGSPAQKVLFQRSHGPRPGWFLKSEQVLDQKMRGPMPAGEVEKMLRNAGVKDEEMEWAGISDYLEEHARVTPDGLREAIRVGQPKIEDVVKGDPGWLKQARLEWKQSRTAWDRAARLLD